MPAWDSALTSKLRVLLHAAPLLDLHRGDELRDQRLRHYAALPLAVKVFDLIVDRMGLDREMDAESIRSALIPLLTEMDRAADIPPDARRHDEMIERLMAGLRNDIKRRRPFRIAYKAFGEDGKLAERFVEFSLVEEHFDLENRIILKLSSEAINLYLGALALEIEDAQAAAEAVLESQMTRGRLSDALESAKAAYLQSVRFQEKIATIRRDTQRDIRRVDWRQTVPQILKQALDHITLRIRIEKSIQDAAEKQRSEMDGEKAAQLWKIWKLVDECRLRHIELQTELMKIYGVFLGEQQRQAFSLGIVRSRTPEPVADILEPLLKLDATKSTALVSECAPSFLGAHAPATLSLKHLVGELLRPKRPDLPEETPLTDVELTELEAALERFSPELRGRAHKIIIELTEPITLTELLSRMDQDASPAELKDLIVLLALHHYAPDDELTVPLQVERHENMFLQDAGYVGDELHLKPIGVKA